MKMKKWKCSMVMALLLGSLNVFADGIYLGTPGYGGSACPQGSVSATLSPDGSALSVLFDQYQLNVGGLSGRSIDRKSCNLSIPVHVPQGMSVSLFQIDYRGFNSLPYGARSQFNVEYFFAGARGPRYTKTFSGSINSDFDISNQLLAQAIVWSPCGTDVILRTNTSMSLQTYANQEAMSGIDSADISAGIIYQLQWRTCAGY